MSDDMNQHTDRAGKTSSLFMIIMYACLMILMSLAVHAQQMDVGNSNATITNIGVSIDSQSLDLPSTIVKSISFENMTDASPFKDTNLTDNLTGDTDSGNITSDNVTMDSTVVYNITEEYSHNISYSCTLMIDSQLINATISGTLSSQISSASHDVAVNITYGLHEADLQCEYNISTQVVITNGTITNTSSQESFQQLHTISDFAVDNLAPIINITRLDNRMDVRVIDLTQTACTVYISGSDSTYAFNTTTNITFNATSYYGIECIDDLANRVHVNGSFVVAAHPFLNISINKQDLNLGEIGYITINAPNGSNVSLTICPVASGWVQCYLTPTFVNENYPKMQAMPYSNKTGVYVAEAVMTYANVTQRRNITFNVVNTLSSKISSSKKVCAVNEIITFNASATGGIGAYTYTWTMHDGQKFNGKSAYKNYTVKGEYTEKLVVNDSAGNTFANEIEVDVRSRFRLTVIAIDSKNGARMRDVKVEVDGNEGMTGTNGEVSFNLIESDYDVYASKEGYGSVIEDIDLDQNLQVYINMSYEDFNKPQIDMLTADGSVFADVAKLKFKAHDSTRVRCELYIAQDGWFTMKDYGDNLLIDTEYTFELDDLDGSSYMWRIECIDENGNRAVSAHRTFMMSDKEVAQTLEQTDKTSEDLNRALDRINGYAGPQADIVEALALKQMLKSLLDKSTGLERDIHNLAYRRDLDEQGKAQEQARLIADINTLRESIPSDIKVTGTRTFIKYVRDPELEQIIKDYSQLKSLSINNKAFFEATKRAQGMVVISTTATNALLIYPDGSEQQITLIKKDISVANPANDGILRSSPSISFVEVVPKTIEADVRFITILNKEYTVLQQDPIIEFPASTRKISYYVNKTVDLNALEALDTVVIDKDVKDASSLTGMSIGSIIGGTSIKDIDGKVAMILLIVLLLLIYLFTSFDILAKLRIFNVASKKKISYIRVLVNDSSDYLATKDYDRAALIYKEIKLNYESASESVKKEVYDECFDLCNKLDAYYFDELASEFEEYIRAGIIGKARVTYVKMQQTYEKFSEPYAKEHEAKMKQAGTRFT